MPKSRDLSRAFSNHCHTMPHTLSIAHEAQACAAILLACLRANELDADAPNPVFYTTIKSRNVFIGHDADTLVAEASRLFDTVGNPEALIDASIEAIREPTRLPLFLHCLDVMFADGLVTPRENKVVQYLQRKLKVDEELAWSAVEIILAKSRL